MKKIIPLLACILILELFGCRHSNREPIWELSGAKIEFPTITQNQIDTGSPSQQLSELSKDVQCKVESPFSKERYKIDGMVYLEKYSELIWNEQLDSLLNDSVNKSCIHNVRKRYGTKVFDVDYMSKRYTVKRMSRSHDIYVCSYGVAQSIYYEPNAYQLGLYRIKCGVFEYYLWDVDSMYVFIHYLIKGKERLPFSANYIPKSKWVPG